MSETEIKKSYNFLMSFCPDKVNDPNRNPLQEKTAEKITKNFSCLIYSEKYDYYIASLIDQGFDFNTNFLNKNNNNVSLLYYMLKQACVYNKGQINQSLLDVTYDIFYLLAKKNQIQYIDFFKKNVDIEPFSTEENTVELITREKKLYSFFCILAKEKILFRKNRTSSIFKDGFFYNDSKKVDYIIKNNYCYYMTEDDKHFVMNPDINLLYKSNQTVLDNMNLIKLYVEKDNLLKEVENKYIMKRKQL